MGKARQPEMTAIWEDLVSEGPRSTRAAVAAVVALLLPLLVPATAGAQVDCTVSLVDGGGEVVAEPSAGCGSLRLAVFSYASTAPGPWSPGAFAFDQTLPQTLADSASGEGTLEVEPPCGAWQADVWSASGPAIPAVIDSAFLAENHVAIISTYLAGLHGERDCPEVEPDVEENPRPNGEPGDETAGDTGEPGNGGGPEVLGDRIGAAPAAAATVAQPNYTG
jgi:hypothetical protein